MVLAGIDYICIHKQFYSAIPMSEARGLRAATLLVKEYGKMMQSFSSALSAGEGELSGRLNIKGTDEMRPARLRYQ